MKASLPYIARDVKNAHLREDSRAVVSNVLSYFKREAKQKKVVCPVRKVISRTSCATGLPKHMVVDTVRSIGHGLNAEVDTEVQLYLNRIINDDMGMCVLRRQILFYCANYEQPPTLRIVRDMIKEQFNITCSKSSALTILNKLGFHFRHLPGSNRSVLLEDSSEALKRLNFLSKLRDYRTEGREVVYVGGTIIPLGASPNSSPQQVLGSRSLLLVHAGYLAELLPLKSMFKFEAADPAQQVSRQTFQAWVVYQLVPFLPKDAVVVFINVPFGKVLREDIPSLACSRESVVKSLRDRGIDFEEAASKPELIETYRAHVAKEDRSLLWLESIVEESGHVTLRMPPYLADLNPMEKVWQTLNDQIAETQPKVVTLRAVEEVMQHGPLYHVLMRAWTQYLAETQEMEDTLLEWSQQIEKKVEDILSGKTVPNAESDSSDSEGSGMDVDAKSVDEQENRIVPVPHADVSEPSSDDLVIDLTEDGTANKNASTSATEACHSNTDNNLPASNSTPSDARVTARLQDFDWICSEVDPSVWHDVACLVSEVVRLPDAAV